MLSSGDLDGRTHRLGGAETSPQGMGCFASLALGLGEFVSKHNRQDIIIMKTADSDFQDSENLCTAGDNLISLPLSTFSLYMTPTFPML